VDYAKFTQQTKSSLCSVNITVHYVDTRPNVPMSDSARTYAWYLLSAV